MSHVTEFQVPRVYFTIKGNPRSEKILGLIQNRLTDPSFASSFESSKKPFPQECVVFENEAAVAAFFEGGVVARNSVVAVFDGTGNSSRSHTFTSCLIARNGMPSWATGCLWAIQVFAGAGSKTSGHFQRNCAEQATAHFNRNFLRNLRKTQFPWGSEPGRKPVRRRRTSRWSTRSSATTPT